MDVSISQRRDGSMENKWDLRKKFKVGDKIALIGTKYGYRDFIVPDYYQITIAEVVKVSKNTLTASNGVNYSQAFHTSYGERIWDDFLKAPSKYVPSYDSGETYIHHDKPSTYGVANPRYASACKNVQYYIEKIQKENDEAFKDAKIKAEREKAYKERLAKAKKTKKQYNIDFAIQGNWTLDKLYDLEKEIIKTKKKFTVYFNFLCEHCMRHNSCSVRRDPKKDEYYDNLEEKINGCNIFLAKD